MNWKTVKIPQWAYENVLLAKGDVITAALTIPTHILASPNCLRCGSELEPFNSGFACTRCNYKQLKLDATALTNPGIGLLLGLSVSALYASTARRIDTRRAGAAQAFRRAAARQGVVHGRD